MLKPFKYFFILVAILLFFTTCKKYPENTLWFKRIKKIEFFDNAKITSYTVNGIDSLALLNKYFGSKINVKDISTTFIEEEFDNHYDANVPTFFIPNGGNSFSITFFYSYSKNKKKLTIFYDQANNDTAVFARSLFVDQITEWDIVKLVPKGTKKIKTTINGNTYEIQFN